jgi:hypothetical protein
MMALDFGSLQGVATQFIKLMGRAAVLRPLDGGSDIPCTALMSQFTGEREGTLIGHDDRRALIAADGVVAPDPELHRLVLDGVPYRIIAPVRAVRPSTTALYYDCRVRGP